MWKTHLRLATSYTSNTSFIDYTSHTAAFVNAYNIIYTESVILNGKNAHIN